MRILEKHIIKEFIISFFASLFIFIFLFILIDSFGHLDDFIKNKTQILIILKYYLTIIPAIFMQISPLACLMGTIYTVGKLNYNNELIAMRTSGLSIYRITYPVIIFGIIFSIFGFLISEKVLVVSQQISDKIKIEYIDKKDSAESQILKNLAVYGFKNRQFFINTFNAKTYGIEGLTILEHDNKQNVISKIFANKVEWKDKSWLAERCFVYIFDKHSRLKDSQFLENYKLSIEETPQDFLRQSKKMNYMNSKELLNYINKISNSGAETAIRNLWIDFYQKAFSPFNSLIMIFIGFPCAIAIRRKAVGFSSIGISILVALLYFVSQAISIALGKNSVFPAMASVLITPIIFICSSLYLIYITP